MTTQTKKPKAKVTAQDSNVCSTLAICSKVLRNAGQKDKVNEMTERVFASKSYPEALQIMGEYCELC